MDPVAIVILVFVCAALGGGLVIARSGAIARFQAFPKVPGSGATPLRTRRAGQSPDVMSVETRSRGPRAVAQLPEDRIVDVIEPGNLADARDVPDPAALATRLSAIERQIDDLARMLERQTAELRTHLLALDADLGARRSTANAELETIRDIAQALAAAANGTRGETRHLAMTQRRLEVCAELYLRLARLEAALCAVTNPMLLPGEPYAPPEVFLPESLVWENWNEVGERAFALADGLSVHRLILSRECRDELSTLLSALRTRLTQEVYPNLQPESAVAQQLALKAALARIAKDLADARSALEREYLGDRTID